MGVGQKGKNQEANKEFGKNWWILFGWQWHCFLLGVERVVVEVNFVQKEQYSLLIFITCYLNSGAFKLFAESSALNICGTFATWHLGGKKNVTLWQYIYIISLFYTYRYCCSMFLFDVFLFDSVLQRYSITCKTKNWNPTWNFLSTDGHCVAQNLTDHPHWQEVLDWLHPMGRVTWLGG